MKTMTCNQLGGACEETFTAATFEEIAAQSKQHGTQMFAAGDEAHLAVMEDMKILMQDPEAMQRWFAEKKAVFEALPEDE